MRVAIGIASVGGCALALLLVYGSPCAAGEPPTVFHSDTLEAKVKLFLSSRARAVTSWGTHPAVVEAVAAHNAREQSAEEIQRIDAQWRARSSAVDGLVESLMRNPCADALRRNMAAQPTAHYREAFATDANGAIVCMTERTSDYWQADETKWSAAFNHGLGAVFVGPVQMDESVGAPLVQLSVPITSGDAVIGVLIVGKTVRHLSVGQKLERRLVVD